MKTINKADIELIKSRFQIKVKNLLTYYGLSLSCEQAMFVSTAMEYVVKNHSSYAEQYQRINEFIFAIDGITYQHQCHDEIATTLASCDNDIPF